MTTAIILIIILVIFIFSIKSYFSKIAHGCCGGSSDSNKKITPSDKNKGNYKYVYKIDIEGMTCSHCKRTVENAFNEKNGFYAEVNLKQNNALVRTKNPIPEDELKRTVQRAGYKVTAVNMVH